jgi:PAS domain S-box-containing protein
MRILLVEDNVDHRELMSLALTGHDSTWEVEGVGSGEEALCLLLGGEVFDLVFLDYSLPQRDGLWFLGEIRRGKASPPVVMVTGRGDEGVAVEAMKRGTYDYVVKQEGYLERLPVVAGHAMERKRAEEALKKSEERFRTSVETLLEGFAILSAVRDSNGQIIDFKYEYINEAGCKMNQKPHEEHMGKTLLELLPTHKEIGLFDEYVRVVETGQSLTKEFLIYETVYGSGERLRQAFDVRITRLGDGFVTTWQDITDKKKGEELLRQSEERLRLLIENSKDVVIMADLEGSLIYYNGPPEYGITAEEALGKNPFSIFEPVIAASLMNQIKLVIKGGEALTFENNIPWRGESFWFLNQMYPIRDEKGRMIAVGLIARDITERKQAEEALKKSAQLLRDTGEMAKVGGWELDLSTKEVLWTEEVGRIHGVEPGYKLKLEEAMNFYAPESIPALKATLKKTTETGEPYDLESLFIPSGSKDKIWVRSLGRAVYSGGKIVKLIGTFQNIDKYKRAEEALRESEEKYRSLFEESRDTICITTKEGKFIDINQAGLELFGYTKEELMSLNVQETYANPDDRPRFQQEIEKKGFVRDFEIKLCKKDGTEMDCLLTSILRQAIDGSILRYQGIIRDITERKRAEDALRESEKRFRDLIETTSDWVWEIDKNGVYTYASPHIRDLLGYQPKEVLGKTSFDLMPPDEAQHIGSIFGPIITQRKPFSGLENINRHKDGRLVVLETSGVPFFDTEGTFCGYRGIDRDITKRKRIEKLLMESERKLRLITENMRDTVFAYDMEGRLKYVNPAFETLTGYTCQELYERNFINYIHPEDEARMLQLWEELFQGKEIFNEEFRIVAKDGQIKWCSSSWAPLLDGKGKQVGVQGRETDITERKWAEEALQESKELFEKTFISQRDALFLLDAINPPTILDCNPAATEVFGYTRQEMVGRTTDFLHVDETTLREFQEHLHSTIAERGFMHLFEFRMRRKDGTVFPTEHSVTPLEDEQGERIGWVSVVRDITERKQSAERILTYQEQLRSLTSELSSIEERERHHIATELHDNISQTLAITKIKLGMAQGLTSPTDWVGSLNEIGELIDQAIQYTRSLTFELSPPILYELGLEAGIEWLTEQIQEKHGIQIGFEDDQQPKPMNEEIRSTLFKGTRELLINIVKHAQASKAKVSIWREDNSIRIRVEDDGVGFSTSEGKELGKTAGFGLFNIRERIKYLEGDMVIESEPGRGTRVTLSAPLQGKED